MSWNDVRALAAWMFCLLIAGCNRPGPTDSVVADGPRGRTWFADVTAECKVEFLHDPGPIDGLYFFPQHAGSGVALFDFDSDGRIDIYLIHNAGPKSGCKNKLFRQQSDGTFADVSAGSGLDVAGFGMGAAAADVNNDGLVDLVLTEFGATR